MCIYIAKNRSKNMTRNMLANMLTLKWKNYQLRCALAIVTSWHIFFSPCQTIYTLGQIMTSAQSRLRCKARSVGNFSLGRRICPEGLQSFHCSWSVFLISLRKINLSPFLQSGSVPVLHIARFNYWRINNLENCYECLVKWGMAQGCEVILFDCKAWLREHSSVM